MKTTAKRNLMRREALGLARAFAFVALITGGMLAGGCGGEESGAGDPQPGAEARAERVAARDAGLPVEEHRAQKVGLAEVAKRYDWRGLNARTLAAVAEIEDDASERLEAAVDREAEENGGSEKLGRLTDSWVAAGARAKLAGGEIEGRLALADLGRAEGDDAPLPAEEMVAGSGGDSWASSDWEGIFSRHGYADAPDEDLRAWAGEDRERAESLEGSEDIARVPGSGEAYAEALRLQADAIEAELSRRAEKADVGAEGGDAS